MRSVLGSLMAALLLFATTAMGSAWARPGGPTNDDRDRYIVVLDHGVSSQRAASEHGRQHGFRADHVYRFALSGYSAEMSERAVTRIARDPRVLWIELDRKIEIAAQTLPTGIDRVDAELSPTALIDGVDQRVDVDVAVIDTGVDLDHPDLNVFRSRNCSLLAVSADDDHGHGSHVAGTAAALDNSTGVVGVAPGARIWAVKVLNALGFGFTSEIVCGIDFVTANASEIEVANMSLGGSGSDDGNCGNSNNDSMHRAICRSIAAGVTYAVAAGNDHDDARDFVPAAYDEVITVSALADFNGAAGGGAAATCRNDVDDTFANFSNFGLDVDVIAPGVCILSTYANGGYRTISGTSMASPHAAGAAALYLANNPGISPDEVKSALQNAGTLDWIWPSQDEDGVQERLINVAAF